MGYLHIMPSCHRPVGLPAFGGQAAAVEAGMQLNLRLHPAPTVTLAGGRAIVLEHAAVAAARTRSGQHGMSSPSGCAQARGAPAANASQRAGDACARTREAGIRWAGRSSF